MVIKSVNGTILKVEKVEPVVEKRDIFNGTVNRRVAVAKDMTQDISGLLFSFASSASQFGLDAFQANESKMLIGNLPRMVVEACLESILKNGYADLSGYSYQPSEPMTAEDMRRDIYAMSDKYTISQLANMNEDELSDILKGIESQF